MSVRYTGVAAGRDAWGGSLDTDTCYFDVVLMQGDAQVSALATGAESRNCKLTLSVDTTSLAEGTYSIQASEYTRGWVGASDDVAVVATAPAPAPTDAPAPRPTDAPVAAPVPTAAPTPSGISVTESLAGATVAAGAAFTAELAYTGNLQKADGVVTLRICEGSATPYAGPADAYDSCAQAGANLATAEAASDGSYVTYSDAWSVATNASTALTSPTLSLMPHVRTEVSCSPRDESELQFGSWWFDESYRNGSEANVVRFRTQMALGIYINAQTASNASKNIQRALKTPKNTSKCRKNFKILKAPKFI